MNYRGQLERIFIYIYIVIILLVLIKVFGSTIYNAGYKKGQVDYQKGIIKYEVVEQTTDTVRRIK